MFQAQSGMKIIDNLGSTSLSQYNPLPRVLVKIEMVEEKLFVPTCFLAR